MDFEFRFTNDKSVGLYNFDVDDIYHSSYGAKKEAFEKFIAPLNFAQNFSHKKEIKVLDICYGIGYNTKAFLETTRRLDFKGKLEIDILEYDKNLVSLSPFVKDGFYRTSPEISYMLSESLFEVYSSNEEFLEILNNYQNKVFIETNYYQMAKKMREWGYTNIPLSQKNAFLHNIYYQCISQRIKKPHKTLRIKNISIKPHIMDARKAIFNLCETYNIVFLDAFTPLKLPTLWSLDFFIAIKNLLDEDSIIVTYSNSAAVRHAMLDAGFYVGKTFDKNGRACGTVATKNISFIKNKLDEYDLGLIKTNAGVYFRDPNLNLTAEAILEEFNSRKKNLNLESSSSYIKKNQHLRETYK